MMLKVGGNISLNSCMHKLVNAVPVISKCVNQSVPKHNAARGTKSACGELKGGEEEEERREEEGGRGGRGQPADVAWDPLPPSWTSC